jgi:hemerythrin-like domain-containing protein
MINIRTAPPSSSLESPIDHLSACHRRIEERLLTLERIGPHLRDRTAEARTALQAVFWFFDSSGANHTADEEESIFPRFAARLTPEEQQFLNDLQIEHTKAEAIYDSLKTHIANMAEPPSESDHAIYTALVADLCSIYRQHIQNEDLRFPLIASRTLTNDDLDAISKEMKQRRGL